MANPMTTEQDLRDALEIALLWIDMRCDTSEFPETHRMILKALGEELRGAGEPKRG